MPRTAVVPSVLTPNAGLADPAGAAVDPTNGHSVAGVPLEELLLRVTNTSAGAKNVTVLAGDNPPAGAAGQGNLVVSVPATTGVRWLGPFTSARFVQSGADSSQLHIDLEAAITGTVTAFHVPRTA